MKFKLLFLDCDGTCYPRIKGLNDYFGKALFAVANEIGYSNAEALSVGKRVRSEHPGMMNFLWALAQEKNYSFSDVAHRWCLKLNYNLIKPDPELVSVMAKIPVRKCLLTNNCQEHVDCVWNCLFPTKKPDIKQYTIENTYAQGWFYPKQSAGEFLRLCQQEQVNPAECCLMDDTPAILKIAEQSGLQTRLITKQYPLKVALREFTRE